MIRKILDFKKEVQYQAGSVVSKIITASPAGNVTLFAFSKGQKLSEHSAPFDAMVQVLEGNCLITISGDKFELSEGQTLIMPKNEPHAVFATADFKMLLTMIK
ncbi:MAG: cupin domain-containing protein [Candidatus Delongbacteria bacterium]|nr:cupin domain-containing protein [Candidatus Delongbacteria bacterium]MCG2759702.1 cupin domain-containing protein [Candidatus Delongbacteria bacterium]